METEITPEAPAAESFNKIIQESKANLAAETTAQVKRGRGRPKGSPNVKGREAEVPQGEPTPESVQLPPGNRPPIDLKPVLKDATKIPFSVASIRYREPALEITDEDAETPTYYLDRLLNMHLPELEKKDPKAFAFWAWIASMALVAIKKIVLALEKKKKQNHVARTQEQTTDAPQEPQAPASSSPPTATSDDRDAGNIFGGKF